jgi:hypothetical protein
MFWFGLCLSTAVLAGQREAGAQSERLDSAGTVPQNASGRPLNFGFEAGNLTDWTAQGDAFKDQPIEGDTVSRRRGDMHSKHEGRFWIGTFENRRDAPRGTLTSIAFPVTKPYASFLVGGGSDTGTYVELLRKDTGQVIFRTSGDDREDLERVVVDLSAHRGKEIVIRLVDSESGPWGHINFDDFRFHDMKPDVPARRSPSALTPILTPALLPKTRPGP